MMMMKTRCTWCGADPLYVGYHDEEWGVPVRDDRELFEHLVLDGAQAGLSWITILRKRENYRRAFDGFDPNKMAKYGPRQITRLMADEGIVRNRRKIEAAIVNARAYLELQNEAGSFSEFLWQFVGGRPRVNSWKSVAQLPAKSPESEAMSKELKHRGFKFVGPTICYAFMQAAGLVNDHIVDCFRHRQVGEK
jgi:DNA-3-methyladenine glycosylase I